MNKWRLLGGLFCLASAGLLAVLNTALGDAQIVFMVGKTNMPTLPAIVLAFAGLGLLVTAWQRRVEPFFRARRRDRGPGSKPYCWFLPLLPC